MVHLSSSTIHACVRMVHPLWYEAVHCSQVYAPGHGGPESACKLGSSTTSVPQKDLAELLSTLQALLH